MILTNFFYSLRILFAILLLQIGNISASHAQHFNLVTTPEYSMELYSSNYDQPQKVHRFLLKITLKDDWQIFARNKQEERLQTMIVLKSPHSNITKINWPEPLFETSKDAYVFKNEVFIPITIRTNTSYDTTPINLTTDFVLCKGSCLNKHHSFDLDIPGKDYDIGSYELIKAIDTTSKHSIHHGFLFILLISLLGGLILNVMPCVLPVISLKAISFTKERSVSDKQNHFAAIAAGNIVFFLILGAIIAVFKQAGEYVGLGFNFQYPTFIITLTLLVVLFSVILSGNIHADLPPKIREFFYHRSKSTELFGSFLSGGFAALMATPCTAPFLGFAISLSLTLATAQTLLCFIFMGIGMALPFILFAAFPGLIALIPSPGPWLMRFKKFLELGLYATAIWLIWVLCSQMGPFAALSLFLACLLFKFLLEQRREISNMTKTTLLIVTIVSAYIVPTTAFNARVVQEQLVEETWKTFHINDINKYIKDGKVVIVDITADWCLTCKYNKSLVWNNPFFTKMLKDNPQIVALRGDYTRGNKEINKFLRYYEQYGIPFSIVFSKSHPHGIVLPTLLSIDDVAKTIEQASSKTQSIAHHKMLQ